MLLRCYMDHRTPWPYRKKHSFSSSFTSVPKLIIETHVLFGVFLKAVIVYTCILSLAAEFRKILNVDSTYIWVRIPVFLSGSRWLLRALSLVDVVAVITIGKALCSLQSVFSIALSDIPSPSFPVLRQRANRGLLTVLTS